MQPIKSITLIQFAETLSPIKQYLSKIKESETYDIKEILSAIQRSSILLNKIEIDIVSPYNVLKNKLNDFYLDLYDQLLYYDYISDSSCYMILGIITSLENQIIHTRASDLPSEKFEEFKRIESVIFSTSDGVHTANSPGYNGVHYGVRERRTSYLFYLQNLKTLSELASKSENYLLWISNNLTQIKREIQSNNKDKTQQPPLPQPIEPLQIDLSNYFESQSSLISQFQQMVQEFEGIVENLADQQTLLTDENKQLKQKLISSAANVSKDQEYPLYLKTISETILKLVREQEKTTKLQNQIIEEQKELNQKFDGLLDDLIRKTSGTINHFNESTDAVVKRQESLFNLVEKMSFINNQQNTGDASVNKAVPTNSNQLYELICQLTDNHNIIEKLNEISDKITELDTTCMMIRN